jgi:tetratricopeptide (TPR) repeat protein
MKAIEKKLEARYQSAEELIKDLRLLMPGLGRDGYRATRRPTASLFTSRTYSAIALTTIAESFRRPRLSVGTFIVAILAIGLATWAILHFWKPAPYKPTPVALDWFNKGTDALRNGAFLQASKAFEQAVANDNKFPLAHARLAEAWTELDYADKAKDEMLRAQSLVPNRSQLAKTDALYLEAINATVTRDFPGAIKAYSEIARLSPNEPQVYVDLGRAYEKNDELKKAIESYIEATNRAPQYATAFLRVAILYGAQLNLPSASANFEKAQALYEALGNFEGQTEVAYERGFLFDKVGKVAEARQNLQRALDLTKTTSNQYQHVKTLLKLGDVASDENNMPQARDYIRQAIELAQANGIDNLTKRGLVDLGNTFLVSGDYQEAEKYYKQSLELAQQQKDNRNAARALLSLGSLATRQTKTDDAVRYIEQALPFYQQGGYRKETSQALALLARAKVQKGDYDAALQAFEQQLKLAEQLGDQSQVVLAHNDVGLTLANNQGRYAEALAHFEQSHAIAKSLGNEKNVALALTNRSNALWQLGRYDEARTFLTEAAAIAERSDASKNLSAWFYLSAARIALSQQNWPEAKARSQQSLTMAGTQFKQIAVGAIYTFGLSQALSGSSREGRLKCEQAVEMAKQVGDPLLISDALLALSQAMLEGGDAAGALKSSLEAQEIFARSGKRDYEWRALLIAARASSSAGETQKAQEYASRAETLLSTLQQRWGSDNYTSYLNRPDVQHLRKQLNELLAQK